MKIFHQLLFTITVLLVPIALGFHLLPSYDSSRVLGTSRRKGNAILYAAGDLDPEDRIKKSFQNSDMIHGDDGIVNRGSTPSSSLRRSNAPQTRDNSSNIYIIGMLGPCGSGKSYASSLLTSKINQISNTPSSSSLQGENQPIIVQAHHIDTDSLAHAVYEPGSKAISEIGRAFGEHVIANGTVDRKALGAIVFRDESEMDKLERIVWPNVKDLLLKRIQDIDKSMKQKEGDYQFHTFVIVEAAVLLDTNWDDDDLFDAVWLVRASADTRCDRLVEKRGMERQDALNRFQAQLRRRGIGNWEEELERGTITAVIENEGFMGAELWQEIKRCLVDPDCWKRERGPPPDWSMFF